MRRREEKRRKFHEALLQTLYPPHSPPSSPSSSSPSPVKIVDDEPFDVTLINPEDYVKIGSSTQDDGSENRDDSEIAEKPSRAQRKRLRKKMLKEEAARRKTIIGPLLPITDGEEEASCLQPVRRNAQEKEDASGINVEEDCEGEKEESCLQLVPRNAQEKEDAGGINIEYDCDGEEEEESSLQLVRRNAQDKEEKLSGNDKTRKVKKRREAKKLARGVNLDTDPWVRSK